MIPVFPSQSSVQLFAAVCVYFLESSSINEDDSQDNGGTSSPKLYPSVLKALDLRRGT
jgi:hypothetical protein